MIDLLTRSGYFLDRAMNALEEKHMKEGGYREKLLKRRLEYRSRQKR
jgi:four helix bundle suffix protein